MNFVKKIFLWLYNLIFMQNYPKSELKMHKMINKYPMILINGLYNMQISNESIIQELDIQDNCFIFNTLPLMNAPTNAKFLHQKIIGGLLSIGKYTEFCEGILHNWSYENPIIFICHSFGVDVIIELIKLLEAKNLNVNKMIHKIVLINPVQLSDNSNYYKYFYLFQKYYLYACEHAKKYSILRYIFNPRDSILVKNKIISTPRILNHLNEYQIDNNQFFNFNDFKKYSKNTDSYTLENNLIDFFKSRSLNYNIYVGSLKFDIKYIINYFPFSLFYIFSFIKLESDYINKKDEFYYMKTCTENVIFDGMSIYDLEYLKLNQVKIIDSVGHFDTFFDWHPTIYFSNKIFFLDFLKFCRTNKIKIKY